MKEIGIKNSFILIDGGYYSEYNIDELFEQKIDFLTQLPAGRILYKDTLIKHAKDFEKLKHDETMRKRGYFEQSWEIDLYGYKAFAYLILYPEQKAKEKNYDKNIVEINLIVIKALKTWYFYHFG